MGPHLPRTRPQPVARRSRPRRGRTLLTALCSAVGLTACVPSHPDYYGTVVPKHPPDEVWTNNGSEPEYIDPGKCSDSAGGTIIFNIFAGLTQPHPVTLEPMPDIAKGWTISPDGLEYTFYLREQKWSDGAPLTAHDFEYAWKRVLDPNTGSKYVSFMYVLKNGDAFAERTLRVTGFAEGTTEQQVREAFEAVGPVAKVRLDPALASAFVWIDLDDSDRAAIEAADDRNQAEADRWGARREAAVTALNGVARLGGTLRVTITESDVVGVRALDDRRLRVHLQTPVPYFLDTTAFYTAMPVPRHVIERLERAGENVDMWTRLDNLATNGAYRLVEWKFRQRMVFEKNPHYWDAANTRVQTIRVDMVDNYNTSLNLYEAGEYDYIGTNMSLPAEFMDHLSQYEDFVRYPYLGVYFYWVNTARPPLDDPRVRKALSLAIDREAITTHITRAGQIPSADVVPDELAGYQGLGSPLFDADQARKLLAQAGYPGGKGFPDVTLIYNTSEGHKQIAEAAQQMWKDNLGIHIDIENQEWKVYLKNLHQHNFQIGRMGWIGDYPDPFTFLDLFTAANGNNHSNWSSPELDRLLAEGNRQRDRQARLALLRQAEQILHEATPVIPFYVYTRSEMVKPYLMGQYGNYQNRHPFKYWWIDTRWYDGVPDEPLPNSPPPLLKPDPSPDDAPEPAPVTLGTAAPEATQP